MTVEATVTGQDQSGGVSRRPRPGDLQVMARAPVERRSGLTRPGLGIVASITLRNLFLITVAMFLILVLLPAVLSAQWASVG
jgi:hypothetical protein